MASVSPSFTYRTPEQHRERSYDALNAIDHDKWLLRNSPSPIRAPGYLKDEQKENIAMSSNVANMRFRRDKRLETRLAELQKDAASLTLMLRSNANRSTSLDVSSFLVTSKERDETQESFNKTPKSVGKRRQNTTKEQPSGSVRERNKALRITTERDQLKFELERTKRALAAAEKKCKSVEKMKKAYDKLKAHCDSLQESLDLSERIRVRQKKLLHQLQLQQQLKPAVEEEQKTKSPARGYTRTAASTCSCHPNEDKGADLDAHEQAPSESTASKPRTPRSVLKPTSSTARQHHSDFDSLLQVEDPDFSTRRPNRNTVRRPSQTQLQQRDAMRQAAKWARSRGAAVDISTSTSQMTTRKTLSSARAKSSYLAPTQASLRRLQDLPRRDNHDRPPFVV